jgi:hypothetical protein
VDDAFMRRMGYRLRTESPSPETYELIFRAYADRCGVPHDQELVKLVLGWYAREQRRMNSCEPRDLIERCLDICRYENRPPTLTAELLEVAWLNYFCT